MSYIQSIMDDDNNGKEKFDLDNYLNELRLKNKYDPRKDIEEDSKLWIKVLKEAEKVDRQIYGNLHGCRCGGARLKIEEGQLKLIPAIGPDQFWKSKEEWDRDRKEFLLPYTGDIKEIFENTQREVY